MPGSESAALAPRRRSRGQALAEFALVAPLVLLLLLITLEFGRAFVGWLAVNNAARAGASYASTHPDAWAFNIATEKVAYDAAIADSLSGNCIREPQSDPTFGPTREPGTLVRVDVICNYRIGAPFLTAVLGNQVRLVGSSSFPITGGCIAHCGSDPAPPPPTGTALGCRMIPVMEDLSVAGARNAWLAAGFLDANFHAPSDSDGRTVDAAVVTPDPTAPACPTGVFFTASVNIDIVVLVDPPPTPTCVFVPNTIGMTVAQARDTWAATTLGAAVVPATGSDGQIVIDQVTDPVSQPDDCVEPPMITVTLAYVDPPPPPPDAPCKVPSLVNTMTGTSGDPTGLAVGSWTGAGFTAANLTFKQPQLPWLIKKQNLVGGTYQDCGSSMEVSK